MIVAIAAPVSWSPAISAFVTRTTSAYWSCASTELESERDAAKFAASTSAITAARRTYPATGARCTAHAIGNGSATPVVSSTMPVSPGVCSTSSINVVSSSAPSTQQTQPPGSSIWRAVSLPSNEPSMPISPSSLTMTPSFVVSARSARRASSRLTSVVFPLPRNPVTITSGTRTPRA